jgi:hypothetical protein
MAVSPSSAATIRIAAGALARTGDLGGAWRDAYGIFKFWVIPHDA